MIARRIGSLCGVLAPVLWALSIAFSASLRPGYSHRTQVISELGDRRCNPSLVAGGLGA